jgi:hypothetical protein
MILDSAFFSGFWNALASPVASVSGIPAARFLLLGLAAGFSFRVRSAIARRRPNERVSCRVCWAAKAAGRGVLDSTSPPFCYGTA